ncbi:MAG: hypothetical protein V1647_03070 [Pseudomonadota bacterium]
MSFILLFLSSVLYADDAPQYKPETVEYKIQQMALNIEAVLPTRIVNLDYKDAYLDVANVPKTIRNNFMSRNSIYNDIYKLKLLGKAKELDSGELETLKKASKEEEELIKKENTYRSELFDLISLNLSLKSADKAKVPTIYAEVTKYLKDYSVSTSTAQNKTHQETNVLVAMPSIYDYKTVWDKLIKVLLEEKFVIEKKDKERKGTDGTMTVKYKCGTEDRAFIIKLCTIKNKKPVKCKGDQAKDDTLYSTLDKGTMLWVEKGKGKTLIVDEMSPDKDIKFCAGEERVFDILEKLSAALLAVEEKKG